MDLSRVVWVVITFLIIIATLIMMVPPAKAAPVGHEFEFVMGCRMSHLYNNSSFTLRQEPGGIARLTGSFIILTQYNDAETYGMKAGTGSYGIDVRRRSDGARLYYEKGPLVRDKEAMVLKNITIDRSTKTRGGYNVHIRTTWKEKGKKAVTCTAGKLAPSRL